MATPVDSSMNKKVVQSKTEKNDANTLPLVVIVGPTASGKSATAMQIAKQFNGEIICADSRTVYKDLDIGTAKPSAEEQALVPHWGLDLVKPGDVFTAADFKKYAQKKIEEIRKRGHLPILVGGTGLYVDGIIFDYEFVKPQPELREKLEALSLDELLEYCSNNNVTLPENSKNRRHLIHAIERQNTPFERLAEPIDNTIIVGIATERSELRRRITKRAEHLFENGMVEEAKIVGEKYGWNSEAMTGNIYPLVHQYLNKELKKSELISKFITSDWRLAKRQLTWLKRNQFIHWLSLEKAANYIATQLTAPK